MKTLASLILAAGLAFTGCHVGVNPPEPPGSPRGLRTATGDNFIELFWDKNPESDLAGYKVFVSSSYDGKYDQIGTSNTPYFKDLGARNGNIYYYAVTAYNFDGFESGLSKDAASDIPRPEGYDLVLYDYIQTPATAGYDFSLYAVVPYNDPGADMYFENSNGQFYMNVRTDSDIQDMGPTNSILDIGIAPSSGWSTTHDVRLVPGNTYVVWTWDDHYAKFRVSGVSPSRVVFDWAYQLIKANPLMKRAVTTRQPFNSVPKVH